MTTPSTDAKLSPTGPAPVGILCKCGCRHHKVLHTRQLPGKTRRERKCLSCGRVWWTTEA